MQKGQQYNKRVVKGTGFQSSIYNHAHTLESVFNVIIFLGGWTRARFEYPSACHLQFFLKVKCFAHEKPVSPKLYKILFEGIFKKIFPTQVFYMIRLTRCVLFCIDNHEHCFSCISPIIYEIFHIALSPYEKSQRFLIFSYLFLMHCVT